MTESHPYLTEENLDIVSAQLISSLERVVEGNDKLRAQIETDAENTDETSIFTYKAMLEKDPEISQNPELLGYIAHELKEYVLDKLNEVHMGIAVEAVNSTDDKQLTVNIRRDYVRAADCMTLKGLEQVAALALLNFDREADHNAGMMLASFRSFEEVLQSFDDVTGQTDEFELFFGHLRPVDEQDTRQLTIGPKVA